MLTGLWHQNCSNQLDNVWEWVPTSVTHYLLLSGINRSIFWEALSVSCKKMSKSLNLLRTQRKILEIYKVTVLRHNCLPRISSIITTHWLVWTPSCSPRLLGDVDFTRDLLQGAVLPYKSCFGQSTCFQCTERKSCTGKAPKTVFRRKNRQQDSKRR